LREWSAPSWRGPRTEAEVRGHLRDYYATITYLDEQLGRIFDTLKDLDEYENTIIIFSSDQGIAIGSHGLMGKQNLYEHSMGVPLDNRGQWITGDSYHLFDWRRAICYRFSHGSIRTHRYVWSSLPRHASVGSGLNRSRVRLRARRASTSKDGTWPEPVLSRIANALSLHGR
jgi:hypothetical protein